MHSTIASLALRRILSRATMDPLPPSREIPSAFTASVKHWWSVGEKQSAISEERLLRRLPFYRSTSTNVTAHSSRVTLNNPKHYINTLTIESTSPQPTAPPPAVLLHGYGAGLGFFFQNFPTLADWAARRHARVFALDWLGMGRSARVPFSVTAKRTDVQARVNQAESFFVDALEEWRVKMGLNKMTLVGHSLGAYFSVVYALRYPDRVSRLVLLSPAGVPRGPNTDDPSRELTDDASDLDVDPHSKAETATKGRVDKIHHKQAANKENESRSRKLFTYLWEEGWSPFQLVRSTFFWGPMLIGKVR